MGNDAWNADRDAKRLARQQRQLRDMLAQPASRAELVRGEQTLIANVASVALALEALELLLVSKGILGDNELMSRLEQLALEKKAQVDAADAVAQAEPSRIITLGE